MPDLIIPFTPEDAEAILKRWAGEHGYAIGKVTELTRWEYEIAQQSASEIFYSARARLMQKDWRGGDYRFHIHADGTITKFIQEQN